MINAKYTFNNKAIRDILSGVSRLNSTRLRVGVVGPGANATHKGTTLKTWEIGTIQEFGSEDGHIPPRPFIRSTLNDIVWVKQTLARAAQRVVMRGESATSALNWAGGVIANAIKRTIQSEVPPPNAPRTVMWKGHAHTLIGLTGALIDAIGHAVIEGFSD